MHDDVRLLMELQDIDYWIGELERSRDYLPDMIKQLKTDMQESADELAARKERLTQARLELKDAELEIAEAKKHLEKYQEQMLTIKTNKEYDALVSEIEKTKTKISESEDSILSLMGEIEELQPLITELEEANVTRQKENMAKIEHLQNEIDAVQGKVDEKAAVRSSLKSKVPRNVMSIYERVRKGRGGGVVVRLKRGACGECYKSQPPQKIQEIKKGNRIQICDSCGRILIWEGDD